MLLPKVEALVTDVFPPFSFIFPLFLSPQHEYDQPCFPSLYASQPMESLRCGTVTLERIVCSVREALVVEATLVVQKSLIWLLLVIGSLPNDVLPKVHLCVDRLK
uniref:Putative calsequestrin-1 n=1 Tax=Davidia involucrata TaxID=16924 RepID=A0A5B7BXJ0_DAVIN